LLVGLSVFVGPQVLGSADASRSYALDEQPSVATFGDGIGGTDPNAGSFARSPARVATTPEPTDAVSTFLDARVAGRLDDAWMVVSERDRRPYPSATDWEDANGVLPTVLAHTLGPPQVIGGRGEIRGTVSFVPMLDTVAGNVPANADATWVVVRERGNWRVSLGESVLQPRYPSDADAITAARAWVGTTDRCARERRWSGPFLGDADDDVARLCDARGPGPAQVGPVYELTDGEGSEPFIAAFGADVFTWARVVPVASPVALDLVLAPIGHQWFVIGAITASPPSSG
jgi:hypothetical protein